jgi:hypothetical protein
LGLLEVYPSTPWRFTFGTPGGLLSGLPWVCSEDSSGFTPGSPWGLVLRLLRVHTWGSWGLLLGPLGGTFGIPTDLPWVLLEVHSWCSWGFTPGLLGVPVDFFILGTPGWVSPLALGHILLAPLFGALLCNLRPTPGLSGGYSWDQSWDHTWAILGLFLITLAICGYSRGHFCCHTSGSLCLDLAGLDPANGDPRCLSLSGPCLSEFFLFGPCLFGHCLSGPWLAKPCLSKPCSS